MNDFAPNDTDRCPRSRHGHDWSESSESRTCRLCGESETRGQPCFAGHETYDDGSGNTRCRRCSYFKQRDPSGGVWKLMATFDFQFQAGVLVRKRALFELQSAATQAGLTFEVLTDDGGWISTTYLARVHGEGDAVARYAETLHRWAKTMKESEGRP